MDGSSAWWYGVANPEVIARLTGKEILQAIIDGSLPHPPISQTLTFWLVEIGDGFAAFEGEPGDHLLNPMGTMHGGWAMRYRPAAPHEQAVDGTLRGPNFSASARPIERATAPARRGHRSIGSRGPPSHL
jgi:hypothetical protein